MLEFSGATSPIDRIQVDLDLALAIRYSESKLFKGKARMFSRCPALDRSLLEGKVNAVCTHWSAG